MHIFVVNHIVLCYPPLASRARHTLRRSAWTLLYSPSIDDGCMTANSFNVRWERDLISAKVYPKPHTGDNAQLGYLIDITLWLLLTPRPGKGKRRDLVYTCHSIGGFVRSAFISSVELNFRM